MEEPVRVGYIFENDLTSKEWKGKKVLTLDEAKVLHTKKYFPLKVLLLFDLFCVQKEQNAMIVPQ